MQAISTSCLIVKAARHLLETEGNEGVTMRRVAKEVGITPMAIYRHYPDRAALLNAIADEGFAELAGQLKSLRLPTDEEDGLLALIEIYLDHALENPRLFELMFLAERQGARIYPRDFKAGQSPTASLCAEMIASAMQSGLLRHDDFWEITFEMGALSHGLIKLYLGGRIDATPAEFRAQYRRSFRRYIYGIRA
jgi:AcrR family transcriptional regulator